MIITAQKAQTDTALRVAEAMASAARTAPKTRGVDRIKTLILTGDDIGRLADRMDSLGEEMDLPFFCRDANCIRQSMAVLLIGVIDAPSGLEEVCGRCGAADCTEAREGKRKCVFASVDLGIAVGSAAGLAADNRVDTRVLFSAGRAAADMGYTKEKLGNMLALPVSISGKSPYFDRG
ncbi:MAG: ferredoxin domain-containing protein [Eubacteriaceae bacterium]|jgi:uncharacterized ferredoxin-like protein